MKLKKSIHKSLGKRYYDDDAAPAPSVIGYLFDSEGFALADSEGYLLDTTE